MARVAADAGAGVVLMHMQGTPATMQMNPHYDDVVTEVYDFLARRVEWADGPRHSPRTNRRSIRGSASARPTNITSRSCGACADLRALGCVILIGTSRKGFLGKITGRSVGRASVGVGRLVTRGVFATERGSCGCMMSPRWSTPSRSGPLCGVGGIRNEHGR